MSITRFISDRIIKGNKGKKNFLNNFAFLKKKKKLFKEISMHGPHRHTLYLFIF